MFFAEITLEILTSVTYLNIKHDVKGICRVTVDGGEEGEPSVVAYVLPKAASGEQMTWPSMDGAKQTSACFGHVYLHRCDQVCSETLR